jgi:hypothetical protein
MKQLIAFIALPFVITLSSVAHFSCARQAPQEKIPMDKSTQQQICAMCFDKMDGISGGLLPDKEQEAEPITNDGNNAKLPREESPECGFFDALGHRISEREFQLEHGVPYPPRLRPEAGSLSVHLHSDSQCGRDAVEGEITQPDFCYPVVKGMGVSVSSLPANCEVMGYVGEACEGEPVEIVPLGRGEGRCYTRRTAVAALRTFGSVLVECEPLAD